MNIKITTLSLMFFSMPLFALKSSEKPEECFCTIVDNQTILTIFATVKPPKTSPKTSCNPQTFLQEVKDFATKYSNRSIKKSDLRKALEKELKLSVEKRNKIADQLTAGTERQR